MFAVDAGIVNYNANEGFRLNWFSGLFPAFRDLTNGSFRSTGDVFSDHLTGVVGFTRNYASDYFEIISWS